MQIINLYDPNKEEKERLERLEKEHNDKIKNTLNFVMAIVTTIFACPFGYAFVAIMFAFATTPYDESWVSFKYLVMTFFQVSALVWLIASAYNLFPKFKAILLKIFKRR